MVSPIKMASLALVVSLTCAMSSCTKKNQFSIEGTIAEAPHEMLYLEHQALSGTEVVDSVKLDGNGVFKLSQPLPEYPDFYRLRLGKQVIPFAVDTLPTLLTVAADAQSFATSYSIKGNESSEDIRKVWLALLDANVSLSKLSGRLTPTALYEHQRDSIIGSYKKVAEEYIYSAPQQPVAYFALFQQVDGQLVFNLYDKEDSKAFAAVANVYKAYQPNNPRTEHLYALALRSVAVVREQNRVRESGGIVADKLLKGEVKELGYIDFSLPDTQGKEISLSSIVEKQNVLLAFSSMSPDWSGEFNAMLSEIYNKYHRRGLQIVLVGLDSDPHIWLSTVQNLPWINLVDRDAAYSRLVGVYNLRSIPAIFLITKGGDELHRIGEADQLIQLLERSL